MRSVKPGRGPSFMGGIGAVGAVIFGIIWMAAAAQMGAPVPFVLFGLVFVVIAAANAIFSFRNAAGENRYSLYDITEEGEEPDPLEERYGRKEESYFREESEAVPEEKGGFCPYCGARVEADYVFCRSCGKKL